MAGQRRRAEESGSIAGRAPLHPDGEWSDLAQRTSDRFEKHLVATDAPGEHEDFGVAHDIDREDGSRDERSLFVNEKTPEQVMGN